MKRRGADTPVLSPSAQAPEDLLECLLCTPKTRRGLIASVANYGLSKHWVYGWLSQALKEKRVVKLEGGRNPVYVAGDHVVYHPPGISEAYPEWMLPRRPPPYVARSIYMVGDDSPVPQRVFIKKLQVKKSGTNLPSKRQRHQAPPADRLEQFAERSAAGGN